MALVTGCNILGAVAGKVVPAPTIYPKYKGFQEQSIAVMVWADRAVAIDYPRLQLDLAGAVQNQLNPEDKRKRPREFKGSTWPVLPQSIVRYQRDHPEIDGHNIMDVAPKLGVTRLIYIEIDGFQTRSDYSHELFRGRVSGTVKVIEVTDGKGKLAFEEANVVAVFPEKSSEEGELGLGEAKTYVGSVASFAKQVVHRFVAYQEED